MNIQDIVRKKSVVSSKGQTVIPKEIREALDIHEGTTLSWTIRDGKLTVFRIPDDPVGAMVGALVGHGSFDEWLEERNEERRREREKEEEEMEQWRATSSTPQP